MANSAFGNIKREPKKTRLENIIEVGAELLEWERQIVEAMLTDEERKQAEEQILNKENN